ncbi:MAG: hypothetical protein AB9Q19_00445 [Candidatus Reddybacter sp.]
MGSDEAGPVMDSGDEENLSGLGQIELPDDETIIIGDEGESKSRKVVDDPEAAGRAARSIVGMLQALFAALSGGWFTFEQADYDDAEKRIAPALEKHGLAESGPLKYAPEVDAILCGGGLIFKAVSSIRAVQQEAHDDKPANPESSYTAETGGERGESSGSFSTQ